MITVGEGGYARIGGTKYTHPGDIEIIQQGQSTSSRASRSARSRGRPATRLDDQAGGAGSAAPHVAAWRRHTGAPHGDAAPIRRSARHADAEAHAQADAEATPPTPGRRPSRRRHRRPATPKPTPAPVQLTARPRVHARLVASGTKIAVR